MIILAIFLFTQIDTIELVGNEIDVHEASNYRLFTDIDSFVSAQFVDAGDSIAVVIRQLNYGDTVVTSRRIARPVFSALCQYVRDFRAIIDDRKYRDEFVRTNRIEWPLVTECQLKGAADAVKQDKLVNGLCGAAGLSSGSAYITTCLIRQGTRHSSDCGDYYVYKVNPWVVTASAVVSAAGGYVMGNAVPGGEAALERAVTHDVIAVGRNGTPIIKADLDTMKPSAGSVVCGIAGCVTGLLAGTVTLAGLALPYFWDAAQDDASRIAIIVPMFGITLTEFALIARYFSDKAKQRARKAALRRLAERQSP